MWLWIFRLKFERVVHSFWTKIGLDFSFNILQGCQVIFIQFYSWLKNFSTCHKNCVRIRNLCSEISWIGVHSDNVLSCFLCFITCKTRDIIFTWFDTHWEGICLMSEERARCNVRTCYQHIKTITVFPKNIIQ